MTKMLAVFFLVLPLGIVACAETAEQRAPAPTSGQKTGPYKIINETPWEMSVFIDGRVGCVAASQGTCATTITAGHHTLRIVRSEDGKTKNEEVTTDGDGFDQYRMFEK